MDLVWGFTFGLLAVGVAALVVSVLVKRERANRILESAGVAVLTASLLTGGAMIITDQLSKQSDTEAVRRDNLRLVMEAVIAGTHNLSFGGMDLTDRALAAKDLKGVDFFGADLDGARLEWSDLSCNMEYALPREIATSRYEPCADLGYASMVKTNLFGANLEGASLAGADLTGADLRDAILNSAMLSNADLSGADLSFAEVRWATFDGANLTGANLSELFLLDTAFDGVCFDDSTVWPEGFQEPISVCPKGGWIKPSQFEYD
jgi:uncharacterized protein YjbI with pentapeptide repeats